MSWRARPFVAAVEAGDVDAARRHAATAPLRALPDQEPALAEGVFVPRGPTPSAAEVARLAPSWERLDRVFRRAPERDAEAAARLRGFLEVTCLALDWGDDHLFYAPDGMLVAWPGERWRSVAHGWARATLGRALSDPAFAAFHARARDLGL